VSGGRLVQLVRYGLPANGDRERAAEDAARREFDRTGRWPDERG
jgi:hypothetical protein